VDRKVGRGSELLRRHESGGVSGLESGRQTFKSDKQKKKVKHSLLPLNYGSFLASILKILNFFPISGGGGKSIVHSCHRQCV
jgi:hypothetical protein